MKKKQGVLWPETSGAPAVCPHRRQPKTPGLTRQVNTTRPQYSTANSTAPEQLPGCLQGTENVPLACPSEGKEGPGITPTVSTGTAALRRTQLLGQMELGGGGGCTGRAGKSQGFHLLLLGGPGGKQHLWDDRAPPPPAWTTSSCCARRMRRTQPEAQLTTPQKVHKPTSA